MSLTFPQLLGLRNKLNLLTSPIALQEIINTDNFVLMSVADREHFLFLEIPSLLALKEKVNFFFQSQSR